MQSKSQVIWSIRELTEFLRKRQQNKFDVNIGVSGLRGNGKSTLLFKIFNSFKKKGFKQNKHQVYSREDVIELLSTQEFGFCWDDEAINSGYKREFQKAAQHDLIKIVTNYRDNFNLYASALPFFYTLDKGLRELIFMHIHIIERGFAVILLPVEDQIHSQDPWDTDANKKVEAKENKRIERNPESKFRYNRLTTFAGYLYFGPMSEKQERIYKQIKKTKRGESLGVNVGVEVRLDFNDKMYKALIEGKLTKQLLQSMCLIEGKKYYAVTSQLNRMLTNAGNPKTTRDFLTPQKEEVISSKLSPQIDNIVPDFPL